MTTHALPTPSSAAASTHGAASPSLELCEARQARDGLATLLRAEHFAMADFLIALADFDRRRGWELLGHSSLFAFLHVDLKLPNPSAYWRKSAAQALHRFPDLIEPLRDGRLCCSSTAELAKVLTEENKAAVLPRFFGLSAREAQEVVAELQPRQAPATRTVVTRVTYQPVARSTLLDQLLPTLGLAPALEVQPAFEARPLLTSPAAPVQHPDVVPLSQLRTSEVEFGGVGRPVAKRDEIEPLSAERSRIHVNVSREFLKKLKTARAGLSHAIPGATMEQVLEAALDLLLEKQAKARGQVKTPRTTFVVAARPVEAQSVAMTLQNGSPAQPPQQASPPLALVLTEPPPPRREGPRETIPAAVRRAVWERDQGRCQWPLDLIGPRSVFARLCVARTRAGAATLLGWLLWPADAATLTARREAVDALRGRLDLREAWALAGDDLAAHADPSELADGTLRFDYRLRPGVVTRSNALDLMRSVGLDV